MIMSDSAPVGCDISPLSQTKNNRQVSSKTGSMLAKENNLTT